MDLSLKENVFHLTRGSESKINKRAIACKIDKRSNSILLNVVTDKLLIKLLHINFSKKLRFQPIFGVCTQRTSRDVESEIIPQREERENKYRIHL